MTVRPLTGCEPDALRIIARGDTRLVAMAASWEAALTEIAALRRELGVTAPLPPLGGADPRPPDPSPSGPVATPSPAPEVVAASVEPATPAGPSPRHSARSVPPFADLNQADLDAWDRLPDGRVLVRWSGWGSPWWEIEIDTSEGWEHQGEGPTLAEAIDEALS